MGLTQMVMTDEALVVWKTSEKERRKSEWKEFYWSNSASIITYAARRGIRCTSLAMTLSESFSSVLGEKAIRKIFPDAMNVKRQKGMDRYDFDVTLPDRVIHIEVKFRTNDSAVYFYNTDNVTLKKSVWMSLLEDPENSYVMVILWDGMVRVYHATEYDEGRWTHNITTAEEGEEITESCAEYKPSAATWTTTVSVPIC